MQAYYTIHDMDNKKIGLVRVNKWARDPTPPKDGEQTNQDQGGGSSSSAGNVGVISEDSQKALDKAMEEKAARDAEKAANGPQPPGVAPGGNPSESDGSDDANQNDTDLPSGLDDKAKQT